MPRALLATISFTAIPSCEPLLTALEILARLYRGELRKIPRDAPTEFVRERWRPYVIGPDGIDRRYYELCVLTELRLGLRSGDVAVATSHGYRDVETYLLTREAVPAAVAARAVEPTA